MTDSWTEDDDGRTIDVGPVTVGEEMTTAPHAEHLYGSGPAPLPPLQPVNVHSPEVRRDIERREALRAEEMEHLAKLRDRVRSGMDRGDVDLESGTEMLLNISKARCALGGVGMYPF